MAELKRRLTLPLLAFYGLGSIVGAGIYVLLGEVAGIAQASMGLAFLLAGLIAGLTGFSYAELSSRYPKSGGSVLFVDIAFERPWLSRVMAFVLLFTSAVSSAVICHGFVGYFQLYIEWSSPLIIVLLCGVMFLVASWGIRESAILISIITLLEVGGLILVCFVASELPQRESFVQIIDASAGIGAITAAAFIAFYAFIGFEDMVSVAEEVVEPEVTMPRGILIAITTSSLLYFSIAVVATLRIDLQLLSESASPLALMVGHDLSAMHKVSLIGMVAILNGALVQIIMSARVLYGMADRKLIPEFFGRVNPITHTPVGNTFVTCLVVMALALSFDLVALAKVTSAMMLAIFVLVNLSLIRIKLKQPDNLAFNMPIAMPVVALLCTFGLLVQQILTGFT